MRHAADWTPSKYALRQGRWRATRDRHELGVASRLNADCVVALYQQYLPGTARGALLDLGCGQVPLYGLYRGHVDSVTCVDWAASPHRTVHLDLQADLSQPLPLPDAGFDTLILSDVLEHVPEPQLLWHEMARLLRPGGRLLMNVPFLYGLHELPHDYGRYTSVALRRMALQAGFAVDELLTVGGSLHVLADIGAKHLARLPVLGAAMAIALQAVVRALDLTAPGRRFAALSAERFPSGYFMVARRLA